MGQARDIIDFQHLAIATLCSPDYLSRPYHLFSASRMQMTRRLSLSTWSRDSCDAWSSLAASGVSRYLKTPHTPYPQCESTTLSHWHSDSNRRYRVTLQPEISIQWPLQDSAVTTSIWWTPICRCWSESMEQSTYTSVCIRLDLQ